MIAAAVLSPVAGLIWFAAEGSGELWPHLIANVIPAATKTTVILLAGVGIVVTEVPAVHVVDEAIPVVVDPVTRDLARVSPDLRYEVGMPEVDAGVHDPDERRRRSLLDIPGLGEIDVGVARILDRPLVGHVEVVRDDVQVQAIVRDRGADRFARHQVARGRDRIEVGAGAPEP